MNINKHLKKEIHELSHEEEKEIVNELSHRFEIELNKNDKSGIYAKTQYMFAFNSNHMEGSTLTVDQTRSLFQTGTLPQNKENYIAKDIEEAQGHFLMFNEMMMCYKQELTEKIIKTFHFRLKQGVFEDMANGYPCGEYKNRANMVSDIKTAKPNEVSNKMKELLNWYTNEKKNLETILIFHAKYESIHPFQDGNGRTGRMIIYKECLKNGIIPVLFTEDKQVKYKQALNKAQKTNDYSDLIMAAKESQEIYFKEIQEFLYDYSLDINKTSLSIKDRVKQAKETQQQLDKSKKQIIKDREIDK